jgi:hypothetical protein
VQDEQNIEKIALSILIYNDRRWSFNKDSSVFGPNKNLIGAWGVVVVKELRY